MIDGLHPYPAYKPSGITWLGDVPEHWKVPRLKDVGYLKSGAGFPHAHQGSFLRSSLSSRLEIWLSLVTNG